MKAFVLLVVSLALFFGLFFGLNYPEIVRHNWPPTSCEFISSNLTTRYCCKISRPCACVKAPSGLPTCGSLISNFDAEYNPAACASNSSSCPPVGHACEDSGGCSRLLPGDGGFLPVPGEVVSCNITCPDCYKVDIALRYTTRAGKLENISYTQNFNGDIASATKYISAHPVNSSATCHYNPHNTTQVLLDVSFTPKKWALTTVFGIVPLFLSLVILSAVLFVKARALGRTLLQKMKRVDEKAGDG